MMDSMQFTQIKIIAFFLLVLRHIYGKLEIKKSFVLIFIIAKIPVAFIAFVY